MWHCTFSPDIRTKQAAWPPRNAHAPESSPQQLQWLYLAEELELPESVDPGLDTIELGLRRAVRSGHVPQTAVDSILCHGSLDRRLAAAVQFLKGRKMETFVERELESVQIARQRNVDQPSTPQTAEAAAGWSSGLRAAFYSPRRPDVPVWRPSNGRGIETPLARAHRLAAAAAVDPSASFLGESSVNTETLQNRSIRSRSSAQRRGGGASGALTISSDAENAFMRRMQDDIKRRSELSGGGGGGDRAPSPQLERAIGLLKGGSGELRSTLHLEDPPSAQSPLKVPHCQLPPPAVAEEEAVVEAEERGLSNRGDGEAATGVLRDIFEEYAFAAVMGGGNNSNNTRRYAGSSQMSPRQGGHGSTAGLNLMTFIKLCREGGIIRDASATSSRRRQVRHRNTLRVQYRVAATE
eukprot:COSAG05_NODE_711_length_7822_cov_11.919720_2_plen_410_part_00